MLIFSRVQKLLIRLQYLNNRVPIISNIFLVISFNLLHVTLGSDWIRKVAIGTWGPGSTSHCIVAITSTVVFHKLNPIILFIQLLAWFSYINFVGRFLKVSKQSQTKTPSQCNDFFDSKKYLNCSQQILARFLMGFYRFVDLSLSTK